MPKFSGAVQSCWVSFQCPKYFVKYCKSSCTGRKLKTIVVSKLSADWGI